MPSQDPRNSGEGLQRPREAQKYEKTDWGGRKDKFTWAPSLLPSPGSPVQRSTSPLKGEQSEGLTSPGTPEPTCPRLTPTDLVGSLQAPITLGPAAHPGTWGRGNGRWLLMGTGLFLEWENVLELVVIIVLKPPELYPLMGWHLRRVNVVFQKNSSKIIFWDVLNTIRWIFVGISHTAWWL